MLVSANIHLPFFETLAALPEVVVGYFKSVAL